MNVNYESAQLSRCQRSQVVGGSWNVAYYLPPTCIPTVLHTIMLLLFCNSTLTYLVNAMLLVGRVASGVWGQRPCQGLCSYAAGFRRLAPAAAACSLVFMSAVQLQHVASIALALKNSTKTKTNSRIWGPLWLRRMANLGSLWCLVALLLCCPFYLAC